MATKSSNTYDMSAIGEGARLQILTDKFNGKLESIASVHKQDDGFTTTRIFHDFYVCILASTNRATQKAIDTQHAQALEQLEDIKASAIIHYTTKGWE